jgi:O-glycosyl hydrolase
MTVSGTVTGATNGSQNNLRVDAEEAFAQYLVAVVRQLTDRDGVSFDLLTPMNEPGADWWHFGGHQEGTHMSPDQQCRLINLLYPLLRQNHLATGIEATEDNDEKHTVGTIKSYPAETRRKLALIASHSYSANAAASLRQLADGVGKPLWISEYGDAGADGLAMARRIRDDIAETHARAWIYWQFAEPDSPWGLVKFHPGGTNPPMIITPKFYILSQFTHFIRPGDAILDSGDPDSLASYDAPLHQLAIVSVNDRPEPADKCFDLSAFASVGDQALGNRTSPQESFRTLQPVPIIHQQLTTTLPAHSVTSMVIERVTSSP